jgi:hypothetical protein
MFICSGTFSKRSKVLNGRNPTAQDHELLNYDYDSEAEWEEEEADGEDIAASDNEDDGEPDDLEYDEFFVRDNDFGIDYDSDGEELAAVTMRKREGEERVGPRFIRGTFFVDPVALVGSDGIGSVLHPHVGYRLENGNSLRCDEREKDVVRLSSYCAVIFHSPAFLPKLGTPAVCEADALTVDEKSSKKKSKKAEILSIEESPSGELLEAVELDKEKQQKGLDGSGVSKIELQYILV